MAKETTTNYPVPHHDPDHRLSFGLLVDLRTALLRHGYPELTSADLDDLRTAVRVFVYGPRPDPQEYEREEDTPTGQPLPPGVHGTAINTRDKRRNQR
ncbi:hypothetical protein [Micromonospora humi]|uniref:Uncharacterized protein n=1 Tax=Micromonospora humi TaxID=745366 RepID=A0A1C5HL82_9ACTN|nr:hypothetical protein [Micromonospora humi]SCG46780.1 hypothetical protein GA0070213_103278 [Micromonospora humi]